VEKPGQRYVDRLLDPHNRIGPHGRLPVVTYDIHIRTADGGVQYPNAFGYSVTDGILMVQVGQDVDHSDNIYFAPGYWWQYVVDPHSDDPLDLGLDLDEEEYEDVDEDEDEDEDE
jgi:hypothetical protein